MKYVSIALAAVLFFGSVTNAQPASRMDKGPRREMAYDKLNLTEDQKAKMKAFDEDFRKQLQAVNSNDNQTVKQQREAREQLVQQHKTQLESLLTPDQKTQLQETQAKDKKTKGVMSARHMDKLKQELNLTDQQVAQLKTSQEALKSKLAAVENNTSLSQSVKREQLRSLHEEQRNHLEQVLTPEQKAKWQGMMKNHPHAPHTKRGDYKAPAPQA